MIGTITLNPSIDIHYTVDSFSVGSVTRIKDMHKTAGGKGLNVSRVAACVGEKVQATGFLGGESGSYIAKEIEKLGVINSFVHTMGDTRSCHNIADGNGFNTEFLEPGPAIHSYEWELFLHNYEKLLSLCSIIIASGSLPGGLSKGTYYDLIIRANERHVRFLLDTSNENLTEAIKAKPYFIKPNLEELAAITDSKLTSEQDIINALSMLHLSGIPFCVVSLGKSGSIAIVDKQKYRVTFPLVAAINPVGSGDSFVAGIAVALSRCYDIKKTLAFASACGTANALEYQTGFVQQKMVTKLMNQVKVENLGFI